MLDRKGLTQMWDMMRQRHGICMRVIEKLPAESLDKHPIPNMRTPKELVIHMYDVVIRGLAEGVVRGQIVDDEANEKKIASSIQTRDQLVQFARDQWNIADKVVQTVTDAQLAATVSSPWNMSFPGFVVFGIVHDEFLHHRGQLYAYARALGVEPPMLWDFENNAPEYKPKATAPATA